jgi:hypothetical protein
MASSCACTQECTPRDKINIIFNYICGAENIPFIECIIDFVEPTVICLVS